MELTLHKTHFQLDQASLQYSPLKSLTSQINSLRFNASLAEYSTNAEIVINSTDLRSLPPVKNTIVLRPDIDTIHQDIDKYGHDFLGLEWTEETALDVEAKILPYIHKGLDLRPTINVVREKSISNYNKVKYLSRKRGSPVEEGDNQVEERKKNARLLLLMDKAKDVQFYPRFTQHSFVEDWRRKQKLASEETLFGLGDKNKIKLTSSGIATPRQILVDNVNRRIIKTLRFESAVNDKKVYSLLNVYALDMGLFEAVLRWGTTEGTSINGDTLRFPIGNRTAVEFYLGHFKGFYGCMHMLSSESGPI